MEDEDIDEQEMPSSFSNWFVHWVKQSYRPNFTLYIHYNV
jgi:hypothetical protein